MPRISISNIARHGIVSDEPAALQPPEAWTDARNMRFIDSKAVTFSGDQEVMEPPEIAPAHVNNIQDGGGSFWVYMSATGSGSKVYAYNSGSHADISQAGDYSVDSPEKINSVIHQGTLILNYGGGIPQYWASASLGQDLQDLPFWPEDLTAKVICQYKNYLVALNTADGDGNRPHRVLVSDSAEPGTLPSSWDHTDPAVDALDNDLSDVNSGEILWGAPLRDVLVIYKAEATWIMRHIGGQLIMAFDPLLQTSGVLAPRCAVPLTLPKGKVQVQFVKSGEDLGFFDGQNFTSVADKKVRKYLNANLDPTFYARSFVVDNPAQDEAWFCYVENGMTEPSMACVWNYRADTITFRAFRGAHAQTGVVEATNLLTYDELDDSITYDNIGEQKYQDDSRRKLVIADDVNTHLLQADLGTTFNGTLFNSYIERVALAIIGQDREGNPLLDYAQRRLVKRVFPKITGNPVFIYLGGSEKVGDAPTYQDPILYDPSVDGTYVDPEEPINTLLPAIKITSVNGLDFACEGYELEVEPLGVYNG
jgi:hypothetical protein